MNKYIMTCIHYHLIGTNITTLRVQYENTENISLYGWHHWK